MGILFGGRPLPALGATHGPQEDSIEFSRRCETNHRRPPFLPSDRGGGIRPPSFRRNPARLLANLGQPLHLSGTEGSERPRPDRADGWPLTRQPPRIGCAPRFASLGTVRAGRSTAPPRVPVLFPVPFERRQLPLADLRAPRAASPFGRKTPNAIPEFLKALRGTIDRRLADTCYEMAEMAATGILDAYSRELPDHLRDASPGVRTFVERTNETAKSELKALVHELSTDYKPRIKTEFALGRRKYERMIFAEHLAHIPLERLSEVGRSDMKANQAAFHDTAKKIGPSKEPKEVLEDMERDHPSEASLIEDTGEMLEEIRGYLIDHDIVTVPSEERAKVIETPRFYRFATAAMNPPGSFEKVAKDAYYYVTPTEESWTPEKKEEWLRHLNYTTLRNISVHECYPGHYVHFLHRMRVGSIVLKSYYSYAFTEGWAHYCEAMMVEEGFGDDRLKLAMLQDALLRDCRYLASVGMHTAGWSWEDATRFFMKDAYLDRLPAEREAKRGTWDPGYLNYTLGKLMIQKLRADWEKQHPKAGAREFHDAFLALGAPPLGLAREHLLGRN